MTAVFYFKFKQTKSPGLAASCRRRGELIPVPRGTHVRIDLIDRILFATSDLLLVPAGPTTAKPLHGDDRREGEVVTATSRHAIRRMPPTPFADVQSREELDDREEDEETENRQRGTELVRHGVLQEGG